MTMINDQGLDVSRPTVHELVKGCPETVSSTDGDRAQVEKSLAG
jgi:hypothetical protein